ncbi:MAG TPA: S1C family serine protease [Stellaceae bacterium]|nr:S1C family serine protease [Stellaceae bacterium]
MSHAENFAGLERLSAELAAVVAERAPAVVSIASDRSLSSGFLWRPGLVVTADEALADEGEVEVTLPGGATLKAEVVGRDPSTDVALLRVEQKDAPTAALASAPVAVGALALVVGANAGDGTAALGIVSRASGPWRSLRGGAIDARIELDLALPRRSEGGLALDASGRAFGMAVRGPRRRVLVIPSATIERVAAKLETDGRIPRGYLGVALHRVPGGAPGAFGAMVMSLDPKGPAAKAGIRQGDVLLAWNGTPIRHLQALLSGLGPDSVGENVTIGLSRAGESRDVRLEIAARPEA